MAIRRARVDLWQYYARDTFVTANAAVAAGPGFRRGFETAVDFFSSQMAPDGYLPIRSVGRTKCTITVLTIRRLTKAESGSTTTSHNSFRRPDCSTPGAEITLGYCDMRQRCGARGNGWPQTRMRPHWSQLMLLRNADPIGRTLYHGAATRRFWKFRGTTLRTLAYVESSLGNEQAATKMRLYAEHIAKSINELLYSYSTPLNVNGAAFGHYVAWIDGGKSMTTSKLIPTPTQSRRILLRANKRPPSCRSFRRIRIIF